MHPLIIGILVWIGASFLTMLIPARAKYIVNKNGGVHTVPLEYVYAAGDRDATDQEIEDYQAAFEDHSHDPPRQHPPIRPEVPIHNPPLPGAVRRLDTEPETIPSPPPPGSPVADTKPNPPEWAQQPRVVAGQQAIPAGPVAGAGVITGADGLPIRDLGTGVQRVEDGPVPVAVGLEGAPHPVYTDPAQRTADAGLPAGSYPPNATDQGLSIPDEEITNDAATVKASKAKAKAAPLADAPAGDPASMEGPGALAGASVPDPEPGSQA